MIWGCNHRQRLDTVYGIEILSYCYMIIGVGAATLISYILGFKLRLKGQLGLHDLGH